MGERGYSLLELLISTGIMLTVTGAIFGLMNPSQGAAQAQPEVADMHSGCGSAEETLFKELMMAGAGPYQGASSGSLVNFFAPILPRRTGRQSPDPAQGASSYKTDVITLLYVPNSYSQTTISQSMPPQSAELKVTKIPSCPKGDELCGFEVGMTVIVFDTTGNFDTFVITNVQDSAGHLQHQGQNLSYEYLSGPRSLRSSATPTTSIGIRTS